MEKVVCHGFSNNGAALYQQFTHLVAQQGDVSTAFVFCSYHPKSISLCAQQVKIAGAVFDSAPGPLHIIDTLFPYRQTKDLGIQKPLIQVC